MHPNRPSRLRRPSATRVAAWWAFGAASLLGTGCTMCPDPFDYSGPVPNGAVTQNDFAARSNGIRPVRATPLPWPPIVDSSRQPTPADGDGPTLAAAEVPLEETRGAELPDSAATVAAVEPAPPEAEEPRDEVAASTGPAVAVKAGAAAGVRTVPGVAPPRGSWMTVDRTLPPPGNVTPPAERPARRQAARAPATWREAFSGRFLR